MRISKRGIVKKTDIVKLAKKHRVTGGVARSPFIREMIDEGDRHKRLWEKAQMGGDLAEKINRYYELVDIDLAGKLTEAQGAELLQIESVLDKAEGRETPLEEMKFDTLRELATELRKRLAALGYSCQ